MAKLSDRVNIGVGAVVERDGKYLISERISDKHGQGEWSFPGGKPDPFESPEEAVLRETLEETGLEFTDALPLGFWTYDRYEARGVHFVTLYFMLAGGPGETDEPQNTEPEKHGPWEWLSIDEALQKPLFSGIALCLARLG